MDYLLLPEVTKNLDTLIDRITENHKPVIVKGSNNDVVIISKEDWLSIEETIYLNTIPGYVESIQEAISSSRDEWVKAEDVGL